MLLVRSAIRYMIRNTPLAQTSCAAALGPRNPLQTQQQTSSTTIRATVSSFTASHHASRVCGIARRSSTLASIPAFRLILHHHPQPFAPATAKTHTLHLGTRLAASTGRIEVLDHIIDPRLQEQSRRRQSTCSCQRRASLSHLKHTACVKTDSHLILPTPHSQS